MSRRADRIFGHVFTGSLGFLAGSLLTGILLMSDRPIAPASGESVRAAEDRTEAPLTRPDSASHDVVVAPPVRASAESVPPRIGADPIADLRDRHLTIPVRGVERRDLHSSFAEKRGSSRVHEAIDILAPRNTPVIAVEDGSIARLFSSQAGGTTIYQFDPTSNYVYYYAHLQSYASGLQEGNRVKRGDVIGYVGTSGNAPENTPHLHFAIFKMTDKKQWWQGAPIDPYEILSWQGGHS